MFNSTHTLVGLAIARAGADRWSRHAAWTAAIASNLPDIDIVAAVYDQPAYIEYHRGITHAIIGVPLLSLVVAAGMYKFSGNFWRTFAIALLAMSTHPVLDYMNTYGLRPFLPFDGTWFYGDALFIIDPIFDGVLLAAFAAGRFASKRRQQFALAGLVIVAMYTAARIELRNLSRSYVASFEKAAVSPHPFNPFRWIGLIDNPGEVSVVVVDAFRGLIGEPDRLAKAPTSDIVIRASQTRSAKVFHDFARFPVTTVTPRESGYSVIFLDVRYLRGSEAFAAKILLDGSLQVVDESLSFSQPLD
jgi:inner membrane protein